MKKRNGISLNVLTFMFVMVLACAGMITTQKVIAASSEESQMIKNAQKGVYRVYCQYADGSGATGSAFVVSKVTEDGEEKDYLVTNRHVITDDDGNEASRIYILTEDNAIKLKYYEVAYVDPSTYESVYTTSISDSSDIDTSRLISCDVVYCSPSDEADFAVISPIDKLDNCRVLPLYSTDNVGTGDTVYALGYPGDGDAYATKYDPDDDWELLGKDSGYYVFCKYIGVQSINGSRSEQTLTSGTIERLTTLANENDVKVIQNGADINHGNSGGPLINEDGAVVGINTYTVGTSEYSTAIYIDYVMDELEDQHIAYTDYAETLAAEEEAEKGGIPVWAIIAIVAAVLVLVIIIVVVIVVRQKKAPKPDNQNQKKQGISGSGESERKMTETIKAQNPVVISYSPQHNGMSFPVANKTIIVGRDSAACGILFQNGTPGVSRRHCSVSYDANKNCFLVKDLNSTNGTWFADGKKMEPGIEYPLNSNDIFYLGDGQLGNVLQVIIK